MRRFGNLFSKVVTFENLILAAKRASAGKKDKASVAAFLFHLETEILTLQEELSIGTYYPRKYTEFQIYEPKPRKICSSDFRDRVVHHAMMNILEPILESRLVYDTYACRPGKGAHRAARRAQFFTKKFRYYLKCDIRKYFDSIDHVVLKRLLEETTKDRRFLVLLHKIIDHQVPGNFPGVGLPIGNLTSQHFANAYLGKLDHFIKDELRVQGYVRYMDDFISFADSKEELWELLSKIRNFIGKELRLELKEKVTRIAPVSEGVPFLGFRIFPKLIRIKRENAVRFRKKIRALEKQHSLGLISWEKMIESVNSMVAHASHANSNILRRKVFEESKNLA